MCSVRNHREQFFITPLTIKLFRSDHSLGLAAGLVATAGIIPLTTAISQAAPSAQPHASQTWIARCNGVQLNFMPRANKFIMYWKGTPQNANASRNGGVQIATYRITNLSNNSRQEYMTGKFPNEMPGLC
ncbi:hypothetical protein [Synechococcus sp. RS9916]|uniref:hypothetical protein n=1 Tax=Synechococcus sp. RS9916 TaxID=221359 RepID=UPI0000E53616|nr:hypothetical protein [Synechococcus sp. RS9916]EAU74633.1 hypothetical protein RS9916_34037 [Synechococcus sp. RS9916]